MAGGLKKVVFLGAKGLIYAVGVILWVRLAFSIARKLSDNFTVVLVVAAILTSLFLLLVKVLIGVFADQKEDS